MNGLNHIAVSALIYKDVIKITGGGLGIGFPGVNVLESPTRNGFSLTHSLSA
jgi:hypothetical protein